MPSFPAGDDPNTDIFDLSMGGIESFDNSGSFQRDCSSSDATQFRANRSLKLAKGTTQHRIPAWLRYSRTWAVVATVLTIVIASVWRFVLDDEEERQFFRDSVQEIADRYAQDIKRQGVTSLSSLQALAAMIKFDDSNFTVHNFDGIAGSLIKAYKGISNLQLAPFGTVRYIHPLVDAKMDNRAALGYAQLLDPARREGALNTIRSKGIQAVGPLTLLQGGIAVIGRCSIFTRFAPKFLPTESFTKAGVTYHSNCSTPETQLLNCYFPGPLESDGVPTHFWGFATVLTLTSDLVAPVELQRLQEGAHRIGGLSQFDYQLSAEVPHASLADVNGVFAHSFRAGPGWIPEDPVTAYVDLPHFGIKWVLKVEPVDGWPRMSASFWFHLCVFLPLTGLLGLGMGVCIISDIRRKALQVEKLEEYKKDVISSDIIMSVSNVDLLQFPMCLMSVDHFMNLRRLISHETARDLNKLCFVDDSKRLAHLRDEEGILFFSHQWAGFFHPDEENIQYNSMLATCDELKQKKARFQWTWVDCFSIPQATVVQQQSAINSLLAYASHCSIFVAVAPACKHSDLLSELDVHTYSSRAWCRLEQLGYLMASVHEHTPSAYLNTGQGLTPLWGAEGVVTEATSLDVMGGNFTCCARHHPDGKKCDKQKIVGVMLGIFWQLLQIRRDCPPDATRSIQLLHQIEGKLEHYFPSTTAYSTDEGNQNENIDLFASVMPIFLELFKQDSDASVDDKLMVPRLSRVTEDDLPEVGQELPLPPVAARRNLRA
eukprot:TRINITY_DN2346_c0_g1_i5.p1 TRINITY_DN2346_c0_g1~~TRINITY_DN2346_c0_g1_i5.p1  ORF type:complete len:796 (+),score=121.91 TRINITY_DN2346_c0_g1_i5:80-2389(+)